MAFLLLTTFIILVSFAFISACYLVFDYIRFMNRDLRTMNNEPRPMATKLVKK